MKLGRTLSLLATAGAAALALAATPSSAIAQDKKPNIIVIMGDDVGWVNIGAYHQGLMYNTTPNLDKLASEGMRFTDYYAEPSCTAGRANFITGELPIRTGLTTVGQAGAEIGMPDEAPTIATALKTLGYETGQFGKNHLGDLNQYLPTVHGFDEYWGYLYHLDAMEDPFWHSYPPALKDKSVRATCCIPSRPTWTIRPMSRAGARSASRRSWTRGRCRRTDAGHQIQHGDGRRGHPRSYRELHRQGREGRQAVLRLDEPDPSPRHLASVAEIPGAADAGGRVVSRRRRDEAA